MSNESELTSEIDWENDRAVVLAAYGGDNLAIGLISKEVWGDRTWENNRANNPTVVAFEQQHRPSAPQDESLRITASVCSACMGRYLGCACPVCGGGAEPVAPDSGKEDALEVSMRGYEKAIKSAGHGGLARIHLRNSYMAGWNAALESTPEGESIGTKDVALGMKRALNACENCDGDLDFAIFVIKKDIAEFEKES